MNWRNSTPPPCPAPSNRETRQAPTDNRPLRYPHLLDALITHADQRPDSPALRHGRSIWTWYQLAICVQRICDEIGRFEWIDQRRLAHACRNEPLDIVLSLAGVAQRILELPIDARLDDRIQEELVATARATWLTGSRRQKWRSLLHHDTSAVTSQNSSAGSPFDDLRRRSFDVDPTRPSLVLWTSGTTDRPRGVVLSQHNLTSNAQAKWAAVPQSWDDRRLTLLPLAHAYARTSDMGTWLLSGCELQLSLGRRGLTEASSFRPTLINAVPQLIEEISARRLEGDVGLAELRWLGCGGAALSSELFDDLSSQPIEVIQGYGLTEASPVICSSSPGQTLPEHVGPPVASWQTRISGGRLFVRGPGVMLGYLDDPDATARKIDSDGWLDTGDLVQRADDGQLKILGRADDVLVLPNGFKVHPSQIEREAIRGGQLRHAVLLLNGDRLFLAIEPLPEASKSSLVSEVQSQIAPLLPPGTRFEVHWLKRPLSVSKGELTAKQTPRRHVVAKRLETASQPSNAANESSESSPPRS